MSEASNAENTDQPVQTALKSGKPLYKSKELSPRKRVVYLVIGDICCFVLFAWLGSTQHATNTSLNLLYYVWVALPFMLGWFLVSPWMGAFRAELATKPRKMLARTALTWLIAWPVAMLIRWLVDYAGGHTIPFSNFLSFAFIALAFNLGLLLLWRWPFALNNELRSRGL